MVFEEMIGETVLRVSRDTRAETLVFAAASGRNFRYNCYADCCSETWVNHISGLPALVGGTINKVTAKEAVDVPPTRQESEYALLWTIETDRGRCDIEVRNSSNGFYGGSVEYVGLANTEEKVPILGDF